MDIHDLKQSISEMSDEAIMEAIRLLRHSRTTDDVVKTVKVREKKKKDDDFVAKLMKLAGGQAELEKLLKAIG